MIGYSGNILDCIVIGGGQAGLSCGYYLKKAGLDFMILDDQNDPGGAWQQTWDSLQIFSPPENSSLPGYIMPKDTKEYPGKDHVIKYLTDYEKRYDLPINRPVKVADLDHDGEIFKVRSAKGTLFRSKTLIAATGTWRKPYIPQFPRRNLFQGKETHSAYYRNPEKFKGKKVMIIGAGNSAAQIYADLYEHAEIYWVTKEDPNFLPDYVDGRYLFNKATQRYKEYLKQSKKKSENHLGMIVQVEPVKKLLSEEKMRYYDLFQNFTDTGVAWSNGQKVDLDVVIYCTGFKSAIDYLDGLGIIKNNRINTIGTKATDLRGLWLVGFGDWTGYASATLIGVGRTAKKTVEEIKDFL